jgi:hypothetical protein
MTASAFILDRGQENGEVGAVHLAKLVEGCLVHQASSSSSVEARHEALWRALPRLYGALRGRAASLTAA